MRQNTRTRGRSSEKTVKDIRRATRKQYSSEEKIRIVLDGLRGEETIAELCRQEGIAQSLYYSWSKEFLEVGVPLRLTPMLHLMPIRMLGIAELKLLTLCKIGGFCSLKGVLRHPFFYNINRTL